MEIILATQNSGKIKEFNELARGTELNFIPVPGNPTFPEETGGTFFENASIKANFVFSLTGRTCLGDDSGLEVDALNGKPGVHSSRFSKEATDKSNMDKLLNELSEVSCKDRSARFKCCLVLIQENVNNLISTEGVIEGKIAEGKKGDKGFGYDPIFIPEGSLLHMAEMDQKEKNLISHRANAFNSLLKKLS
jgi:XTP/dITP diphosphohydrolase